MDSNLPQQASLVIDFLIIGGGLAGLACAIALRRVGHRVLVLERRSSTDQPTGGCRVAPNLSKILYHWGLQEELQSIAVTSQAIDLLLYETGEVLGTHVWDEEMLLETRGEFLFTHYSDLRNLLHTTAVKYGAKVRFDSTVTSIDPDARTVTLESGEVLKADVVIGADGASGLSRPLFTGGFEPPEAKLNMYSTTVPKESILQDEELAYLYDRGYTAMFSWFGDTHAALGFPLGGTPEFGLFMYGPRDGNEGSWDDIAPGDAVRKLMESCESRLRRLGRLASLPVCVPVKEHCELEHWVHHAGRMVVIGEAAHPLPPGSIQKCAMAVEDGAVLAKLFSHLRTEAQISDFLYAFQELRQKRCSTVLKKEMGDILFMTLPAGEAQQQRDEEMRERRDAGIDVLVAEDDAEELPEWIEMKEIFGYDAEDEADEWWIKWGILGERALGLDIGYGLFNSITVEQASSPSLESNTFLLEVVRHTEIYC